MALEIVGVRHHSPACARLVEATIRERRPRFVLIEGPSDMNGRIDELLLDHTLPFAVFSYATQTTAGAGGSFGSWAPFCAYSPEYVALRVAREVSAEPLFIDLPAWDPAFVGHRNRFADRLGRDDRYETRVSALVKRLGVDDTDALWDTLFEQPAPTSALRERLACYFAELRGDDPPEPRDAPREALMAQWIAWAMTEAAREDRDVVVVCGGYHKPALETLWPGLASDASSTRPTLAPPQEGVRIGSYLVPYSFHRLDSFVGYESGMPSPAFHQLVWEIGPEQAAETMMFRAIQHLRAKKQRVSPADAIAAATLASGLARIRGHAALARVDVLDGLAGALVKDALDAPLPWSRRGRILAKTEPLLVELVRAFSGDRAGKLAEGTPRPPLVHDVEAVLREAAITPGSLPTDLDVTLTEPTNLARSRVLHRLRVLGIPGFVRTRAPSFARGDTRLAERWSIQWTLEADAALIERAAYGATLEAAAAAKLEEAIALASGLGDLSVLLLEAALVGIHTLAGRLLDDIRRAVNAEPSLATLGKSLAALLSLWKHDALLGASGAAPVGEAVRAAFERGLWLVESITGAELPAQRDEVLAVAALRDALRHGEHALALDRELAMAVMRRRAHDHDAPPALRGAGLGFLWSAGAYADLAEAELDATKAALAAARPTTFGDFLTGLFALAREEVLGAHGLLAALDTVLDRLGREDFLIAIPALRLAFGFFPPKEKEAIARAVAALRGEPVLDAHALVRLDVAPEIVIAGLALDTRAGDVMRRYGLDETASREAVS